MTGSEYSKWINALGVSEKLDAIRIALVRAADRLGLDNEEVAGTLGVHRGMIRSMREGWPSLTDGQKAWELAVLLVRLHNALDSIMGEDKIAMQSWMQTENKVLGGIPRELVQTVHGLVNAVDYLESRLQRV